MEFKDRLRELRLTAGLTQESLADKAEMPLVTLRGLEQGQRFPSWPSVVKLSKALGVSTDVFSDCAPENIKGTGRQTSKPKPPKRRKPKE